MYWCKPKRSYLLHFWYVGLLKLTIALDFHQGSKNDMNVYNASPIRQYLDKDEWIAGDAGYIGLAKQFTNTMILIVKQANMLELQEEEKNYNKILARYRIVIENVFARIKKFQVAVTSE